MASTVRQRLGRLFGGKRPSWRTALGALALGNLVLLPVWNDQTWSRAVDDWNRYFLTDAELAGTGPYAIAALLNLGLASALMLAVLHTFRHGGRRASYLAAWALLLTAVVVLNTVRIEAGIPLGSAVLGLPLAARLLAAALGLGVLVWVARNARRVAAGVATVSLIFVPFVGVTLYRSVTSAMEWSWRPDEAVAAPTRPASPAGGPRLVWIVFDELDQELLFEERPETLEMPHFDRLRDRAVAFDSAFPPSMLTSHSVPAMLTGVDVAEPRTFDQHTPLVDSLDWMEWSRLPNVFSEARRLGLSSAVVGWYHPYCRLIGEELSGCDWWPHEPPGRGEEPVGRLVVGQWGQVAMALPGGMRLARRLGFDVSSDWGRYAIRRYLDMMDRAETLVAGASPDVVFLHLPVPHNPYIFDREKGELGTGSADLIDNMALADRALGRLLEAIRRSPRPDETVLIVGSDHPARKPVGADEIDDAFLERQKRSGRVPLLVRFPGQDTAVTVSTPFEAARSYDLVMGVLRSEVERPADVVEGARADSGRASTRP